MTDTSHTLFLSLVRTFVPYLVGFIVVLGARYGFGIDAASLTSFLTLLTGTLYYAAARYAEQTYGSRWGWLLGHTKQPSYPRGRHRAVAPEKTETAA